MDQYRDILKSIAKSQAPTLKKEHGIVCKQLDYGADSAVLYLAKPHWTNRFDEKRETTLGIFCAVWVSNKQLKAKQFAYNIHSKKLKDLPGYKLTPRKFADEFREAVKSSVKRWPHLRMDYGPSTLLEGHCELSLDSFEKEVLARVDGLVSIHPHIDKLLEASRL